MEALASINLDSLRDTLVSLAGAFVLGGLIGLERQFRQRTAGLRTNVLVALGAAAFVDAANRLGGHDGAVHVMALVVSGMGFLGAGVIIREGGNVRGLNTAATLWASGAVGAACGGDLLLEATLGAVFVLATNTLLRPVVDAINRRPLDVSSTEITCAVRVVADTAHQKQVLKMVDQALRRGGYPVHALHVSAFGDGAVHIDATLAVSSVDGEQLDEVVAKIAELPGVSQAFWSPAHTG